MRFRQEWYINICWSVNYGTILVGDYENRWNLMYDLQFVDWSVNYRWMSFDAMYFLIERLAFFLVNRYPWAPKVFTCFSWNLFLFSKRSWSTCIGLIMRDTKAVFVVSVTQKNKKSHVHQRFNLESTFVTTTCRIGPQMMSVLTRPWCAHSGQ